MVESPPPTSSNRYVRGWARRMALFKDVSEFFQRYQAVLAPPCTSPPFEPDADIRSPEETARAMRSMRFLTYANYFGLPAIAVPVATRAGLPVSVQFLGGRFADAWCLDLAEVVEWPVRTNSPDPARP